MWRHQLRHGITEQIWDIIFLKIIVFKVTKVLDPKHDNPIKSTKLARNSNFSKTCCCHGSIQPHKLNSTISLNFQIHLRKSPMIWKDYLKLSEIASYSKLARASKAPPPPPPPPFPPGGIWFRTIVAIVVSQYVRPLQCDNKLDLKEISRSPLKHSNMCSYIIYSVTHTRYT